MMRWERVTAVSDKASSVDLSGDPPDASAGDAAVNSDDQRRFSFVSHPQRGPGSKKIKAGRRNFYEWILKDFPAALMLAQS